MLWDAVFWTWQDHYTHELTVAMVTSTKSSHQDQLASEQAALIGRDELQKQKGADMKWGVDMLAVYGGVEEENWGLWLRHTVHMNEIVNK